MRLFSNNGMATQIMERLGMQNAWGIEYEQYGFSDAGLEALTTVDDANFFYIAQENDNIFETIYKDNPVWKNLQFVKEGRVYPLGGDTWTFGGPISAEVLADKVVDAVAGTKTVSHALGTTEITRKPERIVAVGAEFIEHLLALDVQPAGIVEGTTFRLWYPEMSQQLEPEVIDLGDYPPNLEAISQLEPDLIIGGSGLYGEFYDDFSSIAPTVLFDLFPQQGGQTQLQRMEETHMAIADIVGRHEEGAANIQSMHSRLHDAADRLEDAGLSGHKFIYVEGGVWEDAPWMNIYAEDAELSLLLEEMGIENAVGDDAESNDYGFISSSLEGLSALDGPDVHMFYTTALGDNIFEDSQYWAENPVWKNLQFVKAGQVHYLDKVYAFAGPSQVELLADKVVEGLTG
jgi:iron complex transport system substrate-binding protein